MYSNLLDDNQKQQQLVAGPWFTVDLYVEIISGQLASVNVSGLGQETNAKRDNRREMVGECDFSVRLGSEEYQIRNTGSQASARIDEVRRPWLC